MNANEAKIGQLTLGESGELDVGGLSLSEYITQQKLSLRLSENVPARDLTTFGLGGNVRWLIEPKSMSSLSTLLQTLETNLIPWRVIGAGSNVVIRDNGCRDVVLRLGKEFQGIYVSDNEDEDLTSWTEELSPESVDPRDEVRHVFVLAGTSLMGLSRKTTDLGLSGLEFSAGIPASVGGSVRMNAGAHGASISDVVEKILVMDEHGMVKVLNRSDMGFSYRKTSLERSSIILGALFRLTVKPAGEIVAERLRCLEYRKRTQPLRLPSSGSVFKNPAQGKTAAELLEGVGVKGLSCGGVSYSSLHANWLVKTDESATASDAISLIKLGKEKVSEKFGVDLESEIVIWS